MCVPNHPSAGWLSQIPELGPYFTAILRDSKLILGDWSVERFF
jgi:hypothetical protein